MASECYGDEARTLRIFAMRLSGKTALVVALTAAVASTAAAADRKPGSNDFAEYCIGCHSIYCNRAQGPKLEGIIGRKAGSVTDFEDYSDAIKASNIVWTSDKIDKFLQGPQIVLPGGGMKSELTITKASADVRRRIIQFLQDPDQSNEICP